MRKSIFFCLFLSSIALFAAEEPVWHNGIIILKDGRIERGQLALHSFELALFSADGGMKVYTPQKVKSIFYFDPYYNFYRKFVSVEVRWGRPAGFYEVVVNGSLGVVRKLNSHLVSCDKRSDKSDYKYFVKHGTHLISLKDFKHVYRKMATDNPALAEEVKLKRFNPAIEADAIRIIQLINELQDGVLATNLSGL